MRPSRNGKTIALWTLGVTLLVLVLSAGLFTDVALEAWFLHLLATGNDAEKREAARRLGDLPSVRAVPALVGLTTTPKEDLRLAAIAALGAVGPDAAAAIPRLIDLLSGVDEKPVAPAPPGRRGWSLPSFAASPTRRAAATALGRIGSPAVPPLLHELRHGRWHGDRTQPHYHVDAIAAAFQALGPEWYDVLFAELRDPDTDYRLRVSRIFVERGSDAAEVLVDTLRGGDEHRRAWAAFLLGKLGTEAKAAVPALLERLHDELENPAVRCQALRAVVRIGPAHPPVVAALVLCLDDAHQDVRYTAVKALGKVGPRAGPAAPRLAALLGDVDPKVRTAAAEALRWIGSAALTDVLEALRHGGSRARRWAAATLWEIGARDSSTLPRIVACLTDESAVVREESQRVLDFIGKDAAKALKRALVSGDPPLRAAAKRALAAMEE